MRGYIKLISAASVIAIAIASLVSPVEPASAAVYLDGLATNCANGSTTYDPVSRSCGNGSNIVSITLADYNNRIVPGTVNFMRAGTYYRTTNSSTGALDISYAKSGSASTPTIVKAYPGEERQVIIGTDPTKFQYNPIPSDTNNPGNGTYYYPNPAVSIQGNYITVDGIKTFGQVLMHELGSSKTITGAVLQNSDLGGGGPYSAWSHVVFIANTVDAKVYNNIVHDAPNSPEMNTHKATINVYTSRGLIISQNTFYNAGYGADVAVGDTNTTAGAASGGTIEISYNFFGPNKFPGNGAGGFAGVSQPIPSPLDQFLIHHNIFKGERGIKENVPNLMPTLDYNNTFINITNAIGDEGKQNRTISNNLFYNTSNLSYIWFPNQACGPTIASDNNVYYSSIGSDWRCGGYQNSLSFTQWKTATGADSNSVNGILPNFVNANGTKADDFKRTNYIENFLTSGYAAKAGAYVTGNEKIGFSSVIGASNLIRVNP